MFSDVPKEDYELQERENQELANRIKDELRQIEANLINSRYKNKKEKEKEKERIYSLLTTTFKVLNSNRIDLSNPQGKDSLQVLLGKAMESEINEKFEANFETNLKNWVDAYKALEKNKAPAKKSTDSSTDNNKPLLTTQRSDDHRVERERKMEENVEEIKDVVHGFLSGNHPVECPDPRKLQIKFDVFFAKKLDKYYRDNPPLKNASPAQAEELDQKLLNRAFVETYDHFYHDHRFSFFKLADKNVKEIPGDGVTVSNNREMTARNKK